MLNQKVVNELFREHSIKVVDVNLEPNQDGLIVTVERVGSNDKQRVIVTGIEILQNPHYYNMAEVIANRVK